MVQLGIFTIRLIVAVVYAYAYLFIGFYKGWVKAGEWFATKEIKPVEEKRYTEIPKNPVVETIAESVLRLDNGEIIVTMPKKKRGRATRVA